MKTISTKEFGSLVGIAIAAPILALALVVGARLGGVAENDLFLFALALGGAVLGGINGFGRRTSKVESHLDRGNEPQSKAALPCE